MSDKDQKWEKYFYCLSRFWNWVDERDIDKHVAFVVISAGSYNITQWAFTYAYAHPEGAAMVAAIMGPWALVQGAATKWYFDARVKTPEV